MFIAKEDFNTHMYAEILAAISRDDDTIFTAAAAAAQTEAQSYLARFDVDALFGEVGTDRDALLLLYVKDITAWHFIGLANADIDLQLRKTRYDDAIDWLQDVQAGKASMPNWPVPTVEEAGDGAIVKVSSRPRRETNY